MFVKLQTIATTWNNEMGKVTTPTSIHCFLYTFFWERQPPAFLNPAELPSQQSRSVGRFSHKLLFYFQTHGSWAAHNIRRHISHYAFNIVKSIGCSRPSQTPMTTVVPIYKYWRCRSCTCPHYIRAIIQREKSADNPSGWNAHTPESSHILHSNPSTHDQLCPVQ